MSIIALDLFEAGRRGFLQQACVPGQSPWVGKGRRTRQLCPVATHSFQTCGYEMRCWWARLFPPARAVISTLWKENAVKHRASKSAPCSHMKWIPASVPHLLLSIKCIAGNWAVITFQYSAVIKVKQRGIILLGNPKHSKMRTPASEDWHKN